MKSNRLGLLSAISAGALLSLYAVPASADNNDTKDFYIQQSLERYYGYVPTARMLGMGTSNLYTTMDSSSIVGNPAGLGFMRKGELSGTYGRNQISGDEYPTGVPVEQTTNSGMGLLSVPLGEDPSGNSTPEYGSFGLGWNGNYSSWDNDSYNTIARQQKVIGTWGYEIDPGVAIGYSLGWNRDKLQSRDIFNFPMANGFRHTLGAMFQVDENLTIGSNVIIGHGHHHHQFGPGTENEAKTNQYGFGIGADYRVDQTTISANIDYNHLKINGDTERSIPANWVGGDEKGNIFNLRLGVEQGVTDNLLVRAGYRFAGLSDYDYSRDEIRPIGGSANYNAFSVGAGLVLPTDWHYIPEVRVDYGVEYRAVGNDDWQHAVTLSMPFSVCEPA